MQHIRSAMSSEKSNVCIINLIDKKGYRPHYQTVHTGDLFFLNINIKIVKLHSESYKWFYNRDLEFLTLIVKLH